MTGRLVVDKVESPGALALTANGNDALYISSTGDVGIGTDAPSQKLSVSDGAGGLINLFPYSGTGYAGAELMVYDNSTQLLEFGANTQSTYLNVLTALPLTFGTNTTERMRITSDGNVGIGTSTPDTTLHIKPTANTSIRFTSYNINYLGVEFDGTTKSELSVAAGGSRALMTAEDGYVILGAYDTNNTELGIFTQQIARLSITGDGSFYRVIPGGSVGYPDFCARAWVNFNGTGTVAIRASGNVSSITDNSTGSYAVNLTTAMPDANYACLVTAWDGYMQWAKSASASVIDVGTADLSGFSFDESIVQVSIFR